jgi:hypothetical protein
MGIALPAMRLWFDGPVGVGDWLTDWSEPIVGRTSADLEGWVRMLAAGREEQRDLLDQLDGEAWTTVRTTVWGAVPLRWVVTKTCQHTAEHTDDVLRMVLFWDARH